MSKHLLAALTTAYQQRHPGHADQSVHNPHKGAGAGPYTPGGWKKLSKADQEARDAAVKDSLRNADPRLSTIAAAKFERDFKKDYAANTDVYTNGNITVRFRKEVSEESRAQTLQMIDQKIAPNLPEGMLGDPDFPIEIRNETFKGSINGTFAGAGKYQKGPDIGSGGVMALHTRDMNNPTAVLGPSSTAMVDGVPLAWNVPNSATNGISSMEYTMTHEFGHATAAWLGKKAGMSPQTAYDKYEPGAMKSVYDVARTKGVDITYVSQYARQNPAEHYAEIFADYAISKNYGIPPTGPLTALLAEQEGWGGTRP